VDAIFIAAAEGTETAEEDPRAREPRDVCTKVKEAVLGEED
jgi:hypothetical protein